MIHPGTDVAHEMSVVLSCVRSCIICHKACTAAIEMLAVSFNVVETFDDVLTQSLSTVQVPTRGKDDQPVTSDLM